MVSEAQIADVVNHPAWSRRLLILLLLLVLFARLALESRQLSFTTDEPLHISAGYTYVAEGATWTTLTRGHPLLVDAWCALPLFAGDPDIPIHAMSGWGESAPLFVRAFAPYIAAEVERAERATRLPACLLTVLLGAVVARWGMDLYGSSTGWAALVLVLFDPLALGHGMLATNDMGVTALGTLALYATWRLGQRPAPKERPAPQKRPALPSGSELRRLALVGLLFGLTLLAKGSGVVWLAGGLLMWGTMMVHRSPSWTTLGRWVVRSACVSAVAVGCVWAFYGFEVGIVEPFPVPVPAPIHWKGILLAGGSTTSRHLYFLGENARSGGWWAYFPVAFLIKNPLPLLLLIGGGVWSTIRRPRTEVVALAWFPLLYGALAIASRMNIGYRHLLPIHPFLYLLALAALVLRFSDRRRIHRWAFAGLLIWMGLASARIAPHHIAYFNQIAGGPDQGWRYLADSNTDWRQGYKLLKAYAGSTDDTLLFSGPNGDIGLAAYDVDAVPLPPLPQSSTPILRPHIRPAPGHYVISADSLSGRGPAEPDNYAWFRYREPDAVLGHILFVYKVDPLPDTTWVAQCSEPVAPLTAELFRAGFPSPPDRQPVFDCAESWIIPRSGDDAGWYVLHDALLSREGLWLQRMGLRAIVPEDDFIVRMTAPLQTAYRQWDYREVPAFVTYAVGGDQAAAPALMREVYPAPAESVPQALTASRSAPLAFDGPLTFLGTRQVANQGDLEVTTWWRVDAVPPPRSISVMAHLLTAQGEVVGVADGMGVPVESWREGDLLVQRHRFETGASSEGAELWLRTGVYWLDSGERWPVAGAVGDALFIRLADMR